MMLVDNLENPSPTSRFMASVGNVGISKVVLGSAEYPSRLMSLANPPKALWVAGRLPDCGQPAVAIVGSRAASGTARDQARTFATTLGSRGFAVISGGAFGIDAAAHEGALDADAATVAVLGSGIDVVYPDRHACLFGRIVGAGMGALLTEHEPGTPPRRQHFPARNRLISALADAVLVVEAAVRSGALITARIATRRGQRLLAVPGSAGTDALLGQGHAWAVRSADDIEAALDGRQGPPVATDCESPSGWTAPVIEALRVQADRPAGLARRIGWSVAAVLGALAEAELGGWVRRAAGGNYEVVHRGN